MQDMLGQELNVSEESHYIGALGAALFALERIEKSHTTPEAQSEVSA